ncbi:MAG: DUF1993 domain-containing protein [Alphaproteobacteria bacterium]|nr:DUF1993 domain-containing protein [Alphaproteobacteria bacterium]MBU1512845.1 DUF1993 domain-containing protein [Alphaproteobacteria bacterium]MBU2095719.1 DUF1993 domain-containing protein [Alphaproteobacteria bacterium]MBU2153175.1 DUF1993 domain-containing protein [Alphaproteobacteria bacterium]MBU2309013.1 DUF1993 domain-containing protein [Alphaproteobacteria bacterium]
MTICLFTFVDLYSKGLGTLDNLLTKGVAFAAGQGVSEADMLEWRLIDDMAPLRFQANVVLNFARQWPARAAGLPIPADMADGLDVAGYKAAIAEAKAYLGSLKSEQFDGRDATPITFNLGMMEPTLPAGQWLSSFATTNFYFHLSTAYAILRSKGVQIGKPDLFAGGL